jgi:hypothetical protein
LKINNFILVLKEEYLSKGRPLVALAEIMFLIDHDEATHPKTKRI